MIVPVDTVFPYCRLRQYITVHRDEGHGLTWLVTTRWDERAQNAGKFLLDVTRRRVVAALEGMAAGRNVSTQGLVAATSGGVMLAERAFLTRHLGAFEHERGPSGPSGLYRDLLRGCFSVE